MGIDRIIIPESCHTPWYHRVNKPFSDVDGYVAHFYIQSRETFRFRKLNRRRDDSGEPWPFKYDVLFHNNEILNLGPAKYEQQNRKMESLIKEGVCRT